MNKITWKKFAWKKYLQGFKDLLLKSLRVFILTYKKFMGHDCVSMASALTFYSLLSIVPVLAAAFMVAKGLGLQENFRLALLKRFPEQRVIFSKLMEFAMAMLERTKEDVIGGIGALVLLWAVIKLFNNIEKSFNQIWQVEKSRSLARKFSDYLALVLICPILFIIASSFNIYLSSKASALSNYLKMKDLLDPVLQFAVSLVPYAVIWGLFSFLFLFIPNKRIYWSAGVLSGILAGSLFQLWQWIYIHSQIWAVGYGAIYGSFAAVPLFLIWLQVSWYIVLGGAEFCSILEGLNLDDWAHVTSPLSIHQMILLGLLITHRVVVNFSQGKRPIQASQLSQSLKMPISTINVILNKLRLAEVIYETYIEESQEPLIGYLPARPLEHLTIAFVIQKLQHQGDDNQLPSSNPQLETFASLIQQFYEKINESPENLSLKDITFK